MYLFKNIDDVQIITDEWMLEYNNERPHESLRNSTPRDYGVKQIMSTEALY